MGSTATSIPQSFWTDQSGQSIVGEYALHVQVDAGAITIRDHGHKLCQFGQSCRVGRRNNRTREFHVGHGRGYWCGSRFGASLRRGSGKT